MVRASTHEQVVCVGHVAADAEQLHEVVELAVDVAAYLERHQRGRVAASGAMSTRSTGQPTVTGASTRTTLPSSISSSRAL